MHSESDLTQGWRVGLVISQKHSWGCWLQASVLLHVAATQGQVGISQNCGHKVVKVFSSCLASSRQKKNSGLGLELAQRHFLHLLRLGARHQARANSRGGSSREAVHTLTLLEAPKSCSIMVPSWLYYREDSFSGQDVELDDHCFFFKLQNSRLQFLFRLQFPSTIMSIM